MDDLRELSNSVDNVIPINGGVNSVKTANHNPFEKMVIEKVGKMTGLHFMSKRSPVDNIVPSGSLFWNGNTMNKTENFSMFISKYTLDGNYFSRIAELLGDSSTMKFKDFRGRSTIFKINQIIPQTDPEGNEYLELSVSGYPENRDYAYAVEEEEICALEFIGNFNGASYDLEREGNDVILNKEGVEVSRVDISPDRLLSAGAITVAGNNVTVASASAKINGETHEKDTPTVLVTPYTTNGFKRVDILQINTSNEITRKQGNESVGVAIQPTKDPNSVIITTLHVSDSIIVTPPSVGDDFNLSIQNELFQEQFKVNNYFAFKGVSFDAAKKMLVVDPLETLAAFLDPVNGNDLTANLQNASKPFKTFKALHEALPVFAGETYTIYITGGTIPITRQIVNRNFNWVAYTPVTLDFTNCMLPDGVTHAQACMLLASYGSAATWNFTNSNISIKCNYNGIKHFSYTPNNSTTRILGNINILEWYSPSTQNYQPCFYYAGNSNIIFDKIYTSPYDAIYPIGCRGTSNTLVREFIVQYNNRALFQSEEINYLTVDKISQIGNLELLFPYGLVSTTTDLTIGDVNFNTGSLFHPRARKVIFKGSFGANVGINFANTRYVSGVLDSVNYPYISFNQFPIEFNGYSGKLNDIRLHGINGFVKFENCNLQVKDILARNNNYLNDGNVLIKFSGFNSITQEDTSKFLFYSKYDDINQNTITNIEDSGQVVTNAKTFGIRTNYFKINASFKEELKKIVIRSKTDLANKVLDSATSYVADGDITFLAGEFIRVPDLKGLTLSSYGINSGKLIKNVAGESLFISETGGSGDLILQNITIDTGLGSVFNLEDSNGTHAIEMKDVNFENCASLGTIKGYRQFTGQTMGEYNCGSGLTLDGLWNGFALGRLHVRGMAATGTLFKKGATLQFSNRFSLGVNLSGVTGIKLCDFDDTNFLRDEMFQLDDCTLEVAGVINASNTAALIPNIQARNSKCSWTNSKGIDLSPLYFLDLKSPDGNVWRVMVDNAGLLTQTSV